MERIASKRVIPVENNSVLVIKMETKWIIMLIVMIIAVIAGLWIKAKMDEQALV